MDVPLCAPEDSRLPHPSLRHILIASGELSAPDMEGSSVPTTQIIDAAFEQTEIKSLQTTDQVLHECLEHINALDTLLIEHVGTAVAPNFTRLENLLKQLQSKTGMYLERRGYGPDVSVLKQIQSKMGTYLDRKRSNSKKPQTDTEDSVMSTGGAPDQMLSGQITSKQEVIKALDMIVTYYEQNEPSSPVPLLIKRAKRLVGSSFVDIIRDISPDAMSQVIMVSGQQEETSEE